MSPFEYEVIIYNEFSKKENKEETIHGITFGYTYAEAAENLEKYYGDILIHMQLYMNEEQPVYELDSDVEEKWFKLFTVEKAF